MVTNKRLQEIYTTVFSVLFYNNHLLALPFPIERLCADLGLELIPLSAILANGGFGEQAIFDMWGNEDGVAQKFGGIVRIAYNDLKPNGRVRFTQCEEIGHFLLGHLNDPKYNMFDQQFDEDSYRQYEEEARIAAGLILCQPQFFYTYQRYLNPDDMTYLCDITPTCAAVRCDILKRFQASIISNPIYNILPLPQLRKPLDRPQAS